jgi:hypothetical protein
LQNFETFFFFFGEIVMKKILLIVLILNLAVQLFGQKTQPKPTQTPNQAQCSLELTKTLVEQQAIESRGIESTSKRLTILKNVADFLWKIDEQTSRSYLVEAFELADSRFKEKGREKIQKTEYSYRKLPDYRFEVIETIAKYDVEWAKKLTDKILKEFDADEEKKNDSFNNDEVSETLRIALSIVERQPQQALYLFRQAMRFQIDSYWHNALLNLAKKNRQLADQVYSELLVNYSNAPLNRYIYLAGYPFALSEIRGLSFSMATSTQGILPNPNLQKQFLSLVLQRATNYQPNTTEKLQKWDFPEVAQLYNILRNFESTVNSSFPELANSWSNTKLQIYNLIDEETQKRLKMNDKWDEERNTLFEKRLSEVEKKDSEGKLKDIDIAMLIWNLKNEEQYAKAETWLDKIKNDKSKQQIIEYFYYKRAELANGEKRFDDARKYALKLKKLEFRSLIFLQTAQNKLKQNLPKSEVLEILNEIYHTASKSDNSIPKVQTFLGLAFQYEKVDHLNALDSLDKVIKTINNLTDEDIFSSSLSLEINVDDSSFSTFLTMPGGSLEEVFKELSKKDFSNTLSQANSFSDKYYRALAVIEVAKNCPELNKQKPKETKVIKAKP